MSQRAVAKAIGFLESEGAEIHFRKIRLMELPDGLADESNTTPLLD